MTQAIIIGFVVLVVVGLLISTLLSWIEHKKQNADTDVRNEKEHKNIDLWEARQKKRSRTNDE